MSGAEHPFPWSEDAVCRPSAEKDASLTHDCRDDCTGSEPSLDRWNERTEHWYCPNGNDNCAAHENAENGAPPARAILLTERARFGGETGAGVMRNRCAFTARDMGHDWPEAFTYAVVMGWDDDDDPERDAMREQAAKWGWDDELVAFLRGTHERFAALADRAPIPPAVTEAGS